VQDCPNCHRPTPDGNFCVRCGVPLDDDAAPTSAPARPQFAAAPAEREYVPWLVSTLFPQLPRHSDRHFRLALIGGAALVIALAAFRLYPVAVIVAALLMPLLVVLYFYDVDIYEQSPTWAIGWTLGWGAVAGVGVGFLARALYPSGFALIDRGSSELLIGGGLIVPAVGVAVMLIGPIALLRYRLFNETLDGATFGAATAAAFSAGLAVVAGAGSLRSGLRPAGAQLPWIERLVALGVATPVLSMAAIGIAAAALWLRFRAPVEDRSKLGPAGNPVVAIVLAFALVIGGAVLEPLLATGLWLAALAVLCPIGLILLRRAIHIGLLEEADEIPIGPEIVCANCGHETASHTFCGNCGIALKALPNAGRAGDDVLQGAAGARLGQTRLAPRLLLYAVTLAVVAGIGVLVAVLSAPPARTPACSPGIPCGAPPVVANVLSSTVDAPFQGYATWRSPGLGYALTYEPHNWTIEGENADSVELQSVDGVSTIVINGATAAQASPSALMAAKVGVLRGDLLGMQTDSSPNDQLLGTHIGAISGPGAVYKGTINTPQAPDMTLPIALMSATNGRLTILATVISDPRNVRFIYQQADGIVNAIDWGTT
jgi:hypothetical protein